MRVRSLLLTILGCCVTLPTRADSQADQKTLIRNVTVIDGTGTPGKSGLDVVINNGTVESIRPTSPDTAFNGRVINGAGRFLIPGIIDAHVHLTPSTRAEIRDLLKWLVEGGVTSVRDMAGDARELAGIKREVIAGELTGPSIYYVGLMAGPAFMSDPRLLAATKGYPNGEAPYMVSLTAKTDLVRAMAMIKGTGATAVKLYAALDASLVMAAIDEAHRIGLKVWAHSAVFPAKPVEILDAGVDAVSHAAYVIWDAEPASDDFTKRMRGDFARVSASGPEMDRVVQAMVRNGTVLDPTLLVTQRYDNQDGSKVRTTWSGEFTRRAHAAGVPIAAGTDGVGRPLAGNLPAVHDELALLVEAAGLSPLEALTAGTLSGARAIGVEDRVGSIQVGKVADLLLLSNDPSKDIRNTRAIVHVIQGGRLIR